MAAGPPRDVPGGSPRRAKAPRRLETTASRVLGRTARGLTWHPPLCSSAWWPRVCPRLPQSEGASFLMRERLFCTLRPLRTPIATARPLAAPGADARVPFRFLPRLPLQPRTPDPCHMLSCDKRRECVRGRTTTSLCCQPPQGAAAPPSLARLLCSLRAVSSARGAAHTARAGASLACQGLAPSSL